MTIERVIVVGASAGGVRALEELVADLPADFPAPVLIVLHVSPTHRSLLPEILSRVGSLPVRHAEPGEALAAGHVYVAPPDRHLMVDADRVTVAHGPRENHSRPSIDVLFRSAAYHFGTRAIGVVLSGSLSDGSSGLYAIKRVGGIAIIQDPDDAPYDSMPRNAQRRVGVNYSMPAAEIGLLLAGLVSQPPPEEPPDAADFARDLKPDIDIAASDPLLERDIMDYGEPSAYTCPECHRGALPHQRRPLVAIPLSYRTRPQHRGAARSVHRERGSDAVASAFVSEAAACAHERGETEAAAEFEEQARDRLEIGCVARWRTRDAATSQSAAKHGTWRQRALR